MSLLPNSKTVKKWSAKWANNISFYKIAYRCFLLKIRRSFRIFYIFFMYIYDISLIFFFLLQFVGIKAQTKKGVMDKNIVYFVTVTELNPMAYNCINAALSITSSFLTKVYSWHIYFVFLVVASFYRIGSIGKLTKPKIQLFNAYFYIQFDFLIYL